MNLVLITAEEAAQTPCTLTDARATHIRTFLHAEVGSTFRVGILNGLQGMATVIALSKEAVSFTICCDEPSLSPWYDLILALPRPRSFKRILFQSAAMGVRNIFVVGAKKVEKSYFSMHLLRQEEYEPVLIEGMMQGKTTSLPKVIVIPKFRDLWEQLPTDATLRLIANPAPSQPDCVCEDGVPLIAIGPDGGWTEQENIAFAEHGFLPITLGERPLRTDTAAIALPAVVQDRMRYREAVTAVGVN